MRLIKAVTSCRAAFRMHQTWETMNKEQFQVECRLQPIHLQHLFLDVG